MQIHTGHKDTTNFTSEKYLRINSCGFQEAVKTDYKVLRPAGRVDYHLLYVLDGKVIVIYGGQKFELTAGDWVLYPPFEKQEYLFLKQDAGRTFWVHFTGCSAEEILSDTGIFPGATFQKPSSHAMECVRNMVRERQLSAYIHETAENALLMQALICLSRKSKKGGNDLSGLEDVILRMHEHYKEPYHQADYARMCALSEGRFAHKFKEHTGVSPGQYYIAIRMEKAKELLACTNLPVSNVADAVGYDNALYFSRLFRSFQGMSPSAYRNMKIRG